MHITAAPETFDANVMRSAFSVGACPTESIGLGYCARRLPPSIVFPGDTGLIFILSTEKCVLSRRNRLALLP